MAKRISRNIAGRELLLLALATVTLATGAVLQAWNGPHLVALTLRWLSVLLLAAFAVGRKKLTPWIFVAMVAGAEFGFEEIGRAHV